MRAASPLRRTPRSYRPYLLTLEERLPLGDGVLGLLAGAVMLPAHAAPPLVLPDQGRGVSLVGRISNPSVRPDGLEIRPTEAFASAFVEDAPAASVWQPLPDLFAPATRRQRQPGVEPQPLLALRAGEDPVAPLVQTTTPAPAATAPHSDSALLTTLAALYQPAAPARADSPTPTQEAQVKENFGKLPLYFEENVGQTDASVHFFTRGPGYGLYLTSTEAVMVLSQPTPAETNDPASDRLNAGRVGPHTTGTSPVARQEEPPAVVRLQLVGANPSPAVTGRDEQPGKVNYFLGNDPAQWHTNIATFGRVQYDDVYPGIDLVWYGTNRQLEYDFVVSPGADPNMIRLNVSGAERMELDAAGDLLVQAGDQTLRQHKPFVYQDVNGSRQEIASRFVLEGQQVRFAVGAYDAGRTLVIDPVLSYSTYLGGSGRDEAKAIAVDPVTGDALVMGQTGSTNFPTANPFQPTYGGDYDAFVVRLNATGSALVYATYFGGRREEFGHGITVDPPTGDALVTGYTTSTDFPTANPLQPTFRGGIDAFVTRLNATGSALVWSTYFGGSGWDFGNSIAVDVSAGDVFVTGWTASTDFPTANPIQPTMRGDRDVFVARLNATGSALVYATYLGGNDMDFGNSIAVDPGTGDALITGETRSYNFPTVNPLQPAHGGSWYDVFVARLNATGSALVYATYLGGSREEYGNGIAVDPTTGDALVTGYTWSTNFPTANALQPTMRGATSAFVARLNAVGSALVYSTYLGGSHTEIGYGIAVDPTTGDALITGQSRSTDFPIANPIQPTLRSVIDAFVARLNTAGSALIYATYLGGGGDDYGNAIAVDPATGDALVTGRTWSTDFPTANPLQPANRGDFDAFVTRIGSPPVTSYSVSPDSGAVPAGVPFDLFVYALDTDGNVLTDYTGEVAFYSTDKQATLPKPYTFQRQDQGLAYFAAGVTLPTPGTQELYVFDTATYTVWGYAVFEVEKP